MHPALIVVAIAVVTLFVCMLGACWSPRLSDRFISAMFVCFAVVLGGCAAWVMWPGAAT